jgi:hypothetical protein
MDVSSLSEPELLILERLADVRDIHAGLSFATLRKVDALGTGLVQSTLQTLIARGLVQANSRKGSGQRYFQVTSAGLRVLGRPCAAYRLRLY